MQITHDNDCEHRLGHDCTCGASSYQFDLAAARAENKRLKRDLEITHNSRNELAETWKDRAIKAEAERDDVDHRTDDHRRDAAPPPGPAQQRAEERQAGARVLRAVDGASGLAPLQGRRERVRQGRAAGEGDRDRRVRGHARGTGW